MTKIPLLTFLFLLFINSNTKAQAVYPNDDCRGAIELSFSNNSQLQDTLWLGDDMADNALSSIPHCDGTTNKIRRDLWYTFIAADTALSIYTRYIPANGGISYFQFFTGACGSLISVACYNSAATVRVGSLVVGQRYYFRSYVPNGASFSPASINHTLLLNPLNDECTGATELSVTNARDNALGRLTFTNNMSTLTSTACAPLPAGWSGAWKDVWFKFTATTTTHAIAGAAPSGSKGIVYSGQPGSLINIGILQFYSFSDLINLNNLIPGNTYYIRIGSPNIMDFNVAIMANAPANDECINADTLKMSSSFNCENTFIISHRILANTSAGTCLSTDKDVWFKFQATAANIMITSGIGTQSTRFVLSSGSCGSFTCLANGSGTLTYDGLTVGQYYNLQVGGISSEWNPISVCIAPRNTNDECGQAIGLSVQPFGVRNPTLAYMQDATQSMAPCFSVGAVKDLWYQFTATDTAHLVSCDGGGFFQVLSGACGTLTPLYCATSAALPVNEIDRTEKISGLIPGNTYYVRVFCFSGITNPLTIQVSAIVPNDECTSAIELSIQQTLAFDMQEDNGINQSTQSQANCINSTFKNDIWYKFTATSNTHTILGQTKSMLGSTALIYQVYSGSCGSLTSMGCYDHGFTLARPITYSNLVVGNTYYIRQYGGVKNNAIRIMRGAVNDDITGAIQIKPMPAAVNSAPSYHLFGASRRYGKICTSSVVQMDHDVWFYFVAESTSHLVGTNNYNSYWNDPITASYRIEAFRGFAPDSLSLVPKLISCATNSSSFTNLIVGDTVYLRVAAAALNQTNIFGIKLQSSLSMDEPAGAALLSKKNILELSANTTGATQSLPASCVLTDVPDDDIWFKFVAAADVKRIVASNEIRDISLQLFSGTPGNLIPMICSNNIMILPANLSTGTLYYLRAYSKVNAQPASFEIGLFDNADIYANSCNQTTINLGPNIVANPGCEANTAYIQGNVYNGNGAAGKPLVNGWWTTTEATSDAWNADAPIAVFGNAPGSASAGYAVNKIPRSGKGMLGMQNTTAGNVEWSEYVTGRLQQPMKKGKTYFVSFYISFAENGSTHAYNMGALFNNDSVYNSLGTNALLASPQIKNISQTVYVAGPQWYNICGYFTADKDYRYITLGNFGNHQIYGGAAQNSYSFLDDVLVSEVITGIVPLQLLDFKGRMNAQLQSELQWITTGENNTNRFEVEWRSETNVFSKVGTVVAAGNSSANRSYDFVHNNTATGYNYYRLKMIDNDGQFAYSPIVRLSNEKNNHSFFVYPNPAVHSLNVNAHVNKEEMVLFKIVDNYGRIVLSRQRLLQKGSNAFTLNIASLASGTYYLVSTAEGQKAIKILKQ